MNQRICIPRLFLGDMNSLLECGLNVILGFRIKESPEAKDSILIGASDLTCRSLLRYSCSHWL